MPDMQWVLVPEPIKIAFDFICVTNEAREAGVAIDSAQVLASKVACVAMRDYFAELGQSVRSGEFNPSTILEAEHDFAFVELPESDDG